MPCDDHVTFAVPQEFRWRKPRAGSEFRHWLLKPRTVPGPPLDARALSMELFQVPDYVYWVVVEGTWHVFSTWEFPVAPSFEPPDPRYVQLCHGTTLGQVGSILRQGFLVRKQEALKHPSGLYGSDHPGHSFDR